MATAEVGVDLVTKLKDKGFKDLEKSSKKQNAVLTQLGKRLAAAFSVVAVINFGKESVQAFQDAQKEANRLTTQLESLNLGFAQPFLTDFIQKTQLATGISGGVLTDAFNTLSQATNDVTTAQRLLAVSLDISAATGRDLSTVTTALQRGYAGQVSALSRLKIGFTTANLKGRDFNDVLLELENKFTGSSAKAADTLAGKIARLNEAVDEAKEAFGEGLVKGIEQSNVAVEDLQTDIITLGEELGRLTGKLTGFFASINRDLLTFFETDTGAFATFVRSLVKSQGDIVRLEEERGRTALRVRNQILKAEARITAETKKQTVDKKRTAELDRITNAVRFKFDIDAINQQAALRRDLSETDRDRVLQLSALKLSEYQDEEQAIKTLIAATTARYDEAMNFEMVLQQLKIAGFAQDKKALDELTALRPKITFLDNLDDVYAELKRILGEKYTINIDAATAAKSTITFTENLDDIAAKLRALTDQKYVIKIDADLPTGAIGGIPSNFDPASFRFFDEFTKSLQGLFGGGIPSNFDPAKFRMGDNINITINNAGSVLAQNDLVTTITDVVYQIQRYGNNLLLPNS